MWLFSKRQLRTRWLILMVGLSTMETFWKRWNQSYSKELVGAVAEWSKALLEERKKAKT